MVSQEYSEAIVEVLEILKYTEEDILKKIPKDLLQMWEENKSKTYKPQLDYTKSLNEMNLKPKTRAIIAMIYRNFICNEKERKELDKKLIENENKKNQMLNEKYDINKLFKKRKGYN